MKIETVQIVHELTNGLTDSEVSVTFIIAIIKILESKNIATLEEINDILQEVKSGVLEFKAE